MKFGNRKYVEGREGESEKTAGSNEFELKKKCLLHIEGRDEDVHCCGWCGWYGGLS